MASSWDKNWDSHSLVNGYPSFYPRIALVAPSPGRYKGKQNRLFIRIIDFFEYIVIIPDSKVHWANMGPIWGRQDPDGPHVGPMNFAIWDVNLKWVTLAKYGSAKMTYQVLNKMAKNL